MKIAIARSPTEVGGIFRRFRELAQYCAGKHEMIGVMPYASNDGALSWPVRTLTYSSHHAKVELVRSRTVTDVIDALDPLITRIAEDLQREQPDRVLAPDTDLKGVPVIAACRQIGIPVTTFVAGLSSIVDGYKRRPCEFMADVEKYCLEASDALIFPSAFAANYCRQRSVAMKRVSVIHNGIASAFLLADPPRGRSSRIGAVMRLDGIKNPEMLARVAARLRPHGYRVELVAGRPRGSDLPDYLKGVSIREPMMSNTMLRDFYQGCKAMVAPSKFEVSGNVPMEAIAAGTPAVITDQMGICELFHELGLSHLIVSVDDVEATVECLLAAEPIAENIRKQIRQRFAWPEVCRAIIEALV